MNPKVLRRFVFLMALLTVGAFIFWDVLEDYTKRAPGDFETEMGSIRLEDGLYEEAMDLYDQALTAQPDHRGALMGRALVFIRTERHEEAVLEFDYLIAYLDRSLEPDDLTGRGVLAAAYANRGIALDNLGRYQEALDSYVASLNTDAEVVEGPGVVHKILYDSDRISTVRQRAIYIYEQLQKPEEERVMRIPELDARQRMHKP